MGVATYLSPADFLRALARRLRTTPGHIPASRATEELLSWIETCMASGERPESVFLRTAVRLVYEHARLVIGPNRDQIDTLAERLAGMNANRPQATKWTRGHWRKLACLVLENRRLPVVALFSNHPPTPEEVIANIELPFTARYVEDPPDLDARLIPSPPVMGLLDRAQDLLDASTIEIADVRAFVETLRTTITADRPAARRVAAILRIRRRNCAKVVAILQSDTIFISLRRSWQRRGRPNPFRFSAVGT